jgi:hypothetical protein
MAVNWSSKSVDAVPPDAVAAVAITSPHDRFLHVHPTYISPGTICRGGLTSTWRKGADATGLCEGVPLPFIGRLMAITDPLMQEYCLRQNDSDPQTGLAFRVQLLFSYLNDTLIRDR